MIGESAIGYLGIGLSDIDFSVPDAFRELLKDEEIELQYLVEVTPFDPTEIITPFFAKPIGGDAIGRYNYSYSGTTNTLYFSDKGYVTANSTQVPHHTVYKPLISNPFQYDVSILNGDDFRGGGLSFGSVRFYSGDTELDFMMDYYWGGRSIQVFAGGLDFVRDEFTKIFDGLIAKPEYDEEEIILNIQDKSQILETEFFQNLYAGTGGYEGGADIEGNPKPLAYGFCDNVSPVLLDASINLYQVHDGSIEAVTAVYDRGVSLTFESNHNGDLLTAHVPASKYSTDLGRGLIRLGSTPDGKITADIQGDNTGGFISKAGAITQRLAKTKLGAKSLSSDTIDEGRFNQIDTLIDYDTGIYITQNTNLTSILDTLLLPSHIYWTFNRQGQLSGGIINAPSNPVFTLDENSVLADSLECINVIDAAWRIKVGYGKNNTVQSLTDLAPAALSAQKEFAIENYRYVVSEDRSVRAKTASAVEREFNTLVDSQADALLLLDRLKSIYGVQRKVYRLTVKDLLFRLFIGDIVNVQINRYDLNDKNFMIVSISDDAETNETILELWG